MLKNLPIIVAVIAVVALPLLLREGESTVTESDETIAVITPHDEGIRHEFERGFADYYLEKTGKTVDIDWRVIGGTSEIVRYIQSTYLNNFRNYWINELGEEWSFAVQESFMNRKLPLDDTPEDDSEEERAKRIFKGSDVSCGLDIFFGGGSYDFIQQGRSGTLVPFANADELLEILPPGEVPQSFSGEPFYDEEALWAGAVLSQFGIIYNADALIALDVDRPPAQWSDLTDPRYFGELAICDPTQSGSSTKAFEMIVQQQMLDLVSHASSDEDRSVAISEGWDSAMQLIQLICANARYFTDSSKKPSLDVSSGECAAGMSIDFYGRFQAETIFNRSGSDRFKYVTPQGGSTVSVDPIALFRGAPNEALSKEFIRYVLSPAGQKLWNWKPGTPEGTEKYALRRSPMLKSLYSREFEPFRSDPTNDPYIEAGSFVITPNGPLDYSVRYVSSSKLHLSTPIRS